RRQARNLLVSHGRDAVTLRAIARELGITAPALYRYYDSREDLLRRLADDICTDLAVELDADLAVIPADDITAQVFSVCRGFRRWALAHPQEFALVFASTEATLGVCEPDQRKQVGDQFGRIFLEVAGRLIASHPAPAAVPRTDVPESLHADLEVFRQVLLDTIAAQGVPVDPEGLPLSVVFHVTQSWVRLYGHVALEVFGRFPFAIGNPEPMFDSMLVQILAEMGFTD
ncbi:MAG: helix-turn-helix transcriptional regulator, partial [Saccharothrix sp.]|nr:helix-turn-helix transcriptional regulator [Saccharothrix sp.]